MLTLATPAKAAVTVGSNISVFPNRDMVVAVGYEEGEQLLIEVLRNDVVIGTTQGPAVETPEGIGIEVNHGPLGSPQPGDCWTNYTPDIIGGDIIRVTAVGRAGQPSDTVTVEDVAFSGAPVLEEDGTVTVSGTGTSRDFAVEFRRDKPDPRFRRGPFAPAFAADGTWKATFRPTATSTEGLSADQQRQIALEEASWLAVADNITATTLAELGEPGGVGPGCNGSADPNTLVGGLEPINIASGDVTFSGTARAGVAAVSVTVGGLGAKDATVTPGATATQPGTWTLTVPKTELATLPDGNVAVTPRFDGLAGTTRNIAKDTTAPAAPTPSVAPGRVTSAQSVALNKPAGEGTSKVYWEIGASAVPDPNEFSTLYTSQISVTSTQTIKARLIDAAGNPGAVGSFTYTFGNVAPSAPTIGAPTAGSGSATVRWTAPTDNGGAAITGYSVRTYSGATLVRTTAVGNVASTTIGTLTNGTAYTFDVRAINSAGTSEASAQSTAVTPQAAPTAPGAPTGAAATAGSASATVRWTAPTNTGGSAITGYSVRTYSGATLVRTTAVGNVASTTIGTLTNGTPYTFDVRAVNAIGTSVASARTTAVTPAATAPVTRTVTLTPNADAQVKQAGATTNWGAHTGLWMSTQDTTSTSSRVQSYVRYTVPAPQAGETITARLNVNVTNVTSNGPAIFRTSPTWTESTMTWNTGRPARSTTTAAGNFGSMTALGRVSTAVSGVTSGEVSFELAPEVTDGVGFSSKEAGTTTAPQLIVTYTK